MLNDPIKRDGFGNGHTDKRTILYEEHGAFNSVSKVMWVLQECSIVAQMDDSKRN